MMWELWLSLGAICIGILIGEFIFNTQKAEPINLAETFKDGWN